jgi:hypothetical protein
MASGSFFKELDRTALSHIWCFAVGSTTVNVEAIVPSARTLNDIIRVGAEAKLRNLLRGWHLGLFPAGTITTQIGQWPSARLHA